MSEELQDEITSINSIYGDQTLVVCADSPSIYLLSLPSIPSISLRVEFPDNYPDAPPSILGTQSVGHDAAKGEGTHVVELFRETLAEIYTPGAPCIFDVIEESGQILQQLHISNGGSKTEKSQAADEESFHGQQIPSQEPLEPRADHSIESQWESLVETPPWILSEVLSEKKSVFVARAAAVQSVAQAQQYLAHLLATDKKVAKATHNITAWRIRGDNGVQFQDCDDDGETAAGGRVLHLLELMNVWDTMVVVTRWYGGVQLGPDRFRLINQTARDALVKGSFVAEAKETSTKKRKK